MRKDTVLRLSDSAGEYEQEVFGCSSPKRIILGIHGNGVRRWDGEKFFYQVSDHFIDSIVVLVDQNQVVGDGCKLNSLDIMASRTQKALSAVQKQYPDLPVWALGHSMGCGIISLLDVSTLTGIVFVAPGAGAQLDKYIERYGADIVNGKTVQTTDGLTKIISKEFMDSAKNVIWQEKYAELIKKLPNIHVFEAGDDEIVDEERFELRDMPFSSYTIIEGARHNFSGQFSSQLFQYIDTII